MIFRSDEEILQECEKLGEAGVEAHLAEGLFHDNPAPARQWLAMHRGLREQKALRYTRWTAYGTWALAVATIALVIATIALVEGASKDARESREQQSKDQRDLLRAQVAIELDKEFDSLEMRQARRRLAKLLLNKSDVANEDRVPNFFDKLGLYMHQGRIDEDTVYNEFSMVVESYWPALKQSILEERRADKASEEYAHFEKLYQEMLARDKAGPDNFIEVSPQEVKDFLISERYLPK